MSNAMESDAKLQNKIARWRGMGLSKQEIDLRIKQSMADRAESATTGISRSKIRKRRLNDALTSYVSKRGNTMNVKNAIRGVQEVSRSPRKRTNEYLLALMDPFGRMSHIPDLFTYPKGLEQVRTVFTAFTSATKAGSTITINDTINFVVAPELITVLSPYTGYYDTPGYPPKYSDPMSCYGFDQWLAVLSYVRYAQGGVKVRYIGPALSNSGEIAVGLFPPWVDLPPSSFQKEEKKDTKHCGPRIVSDFRCDKSEKKNVPRLESFPRKRLGASLPTIDFDLVSTYNFSYSGAARDGCEHVWMPASSVDTMVQPLDELVGFGSPWLAVGSKGLPTPEVPTEDGTNYLGVFQIETVWNIETYSISQLLTATQKAGKPSVAAMEQAHAVMGAAYKEGALGGPSGDGTVYKQIANVAKSAFNFAWDNREMIIPAAEVAMSLLA